MRSAIILAGGGSTRIDGDKGLRLLRGEALINHVIRKVDRFTDEIVVVVASKQQERSYKKNINEKVKILVDLYPSGSPLVGAVTGFSQAKGAHALVTGCDMPFISPEAINFLFDNVDDYDGVVFQWPNEWIEPLFAIYRVKAALKVGLNLLRKENYRLRFILNLMPNVNKIPIKYLRKIDPKLLSLFDADTEENLRQAETLLNNAK